MSAAKINKQVVYFTTGQVAKALRVSVSTLKRWLNEENILENLRENSSGWKLFSEKDVFLLKELQRRKRKQGKVFKPSTLKPVEK